MLNATAPLIVDRLLESGIVTHDPLAISRCKVADIVVPPAMIMLNGPSTTNPFVAGMFVPLSADVIEPDFTLAICHLMTSSITAFIASLMTDEIIDCVVTIGSVT